MESTNGNFRICATCEHWCGSRRLHFTKRMVESNRDTIGQCGHPEWFRLDYQKKSNDMCGKWERWGQLID